MSDKPVAERLQVKGQRRLAVVGAPDGLDDAIGAGQQRCDLAEADVVLVFAADLCQLDAALPGMLAQVPEVAILWIAYPKLTSTLAGDLDRDVIRQLVPGFGLDTVSQIAIDRDWSALRVKRVG